MMYLVVLMKQQESLLLTTDRAMMCVKRESFSILVVPSVGPGADPGVQAVSPQVT